MTITWMCIFLGGKMESDAPPETPASVIKLPRKCLTGIQKKTLLMFLQIRSEDGKLDKGAVAAAMEQWGVKKTQIYSLWNEARKSTFTIARNLKLSLKPCHQKKSKNVAGTLFH